ncbi:hypothetical protein ACTQ3J_05810 [Oscillospiraceae bacterium LCP25S3_E3]
MNIIVSAIIGIFAGLILIYILKHCYLISSIVKEKYKPYFKLNLLEQIIDIEILLLLFCISLIVLCFFKEWFDLDINIVDILINIGCSIITTVVLSVVIYFKFLKHIPDETKKQIDTLLNDRLGYEATNHNAVLQKSDSVQNFLSTEHSEIKQSISSANKSISYLYGEFNTDRELKRLQYEYLKDNDKAIIDAVNKISVLGEALEKTNYENTALKAENEKVVQENVKLKEQLAQYIKPEQNNKRTQTVNL